MYVVKISLIETDSGEELEATEREFGDDLDKAQDAYEDSVADMMCMD